MDKLVLVLRADDVVNAFKKAKTDGRKNIIKLPITKSLSIPHDVVGDFGACKVLCDLQSKVLVLLQAVQFVLF
jgi:ribosomal protein S5